MNSADEVPAGEYVRYVDASKGQYFDVGKPPQYEARGFLWGGGVLAAAWNVTCRCPQPHARHPQHQHQAYGGKQFCTASATVRLETDAGKKHR